MLAIISPCDAPGCDGHVGFDMPPPDGKDAHLFGVCDRCGVSYTLYGGIRRPVSLRDLPPSAHAGRRVPCPN